MNVAESLSATVYRLWATSYNANFLRHSLRESIPHDWSSTARMISPVENTFFMSLTIVVTRYLIVGYAEENKANGHPYY